MTHQVEAEQLELLRRRVQYPDDRWFAYENQALDSSNRGEVQYLLVGKERTHKVPPAHMPDTSRGLGWKWQSLGEVDLETGCVKETPK